MEWTQEKGAFYNFSIEPQATVTNTNNTFVQMEVRYNTMYNVNIVAYSYHAHCSRASNAITLKYGKCKFVDYWFWSNECNIYICTLFSFLQLSVIIHSPIEYSLLVITHQW